MTLPRSDRGACPPSCETGSDGQRRSCAGAPRRRLLRNPLSSPSRGSFSPVHTAILRAAVHTASMFRADIAGSRCRLLSCCTGASRPRKISRSAHGVHAEAHRCLVAYPAQSSAANGSKCWNWFSPQHQTRGTGEASLIAGITQQVIEDFPVDPQRIYIAGLSAGGAAAAIMGAAYPDLYAAVGVHSGLACGAAHDVPSALTAMRLGEPSGRGGMPAAPRVMIPTIVFQGDRDSTVNPRNSEQVLAQAGADRELERLVERGQVPGGHAYTRTIHGPPGCGDAGVLDNSRRRPRVVGRQSGRLIYRFKWTRCRAGNAAILSGTSA